MCERSGGDRLTVFLVFRLSLYLPWATMIPLEHGGSRLGSESEL